MYNMKWIFPSPDSWTTIRCKSGICIVRYESNLFEVRIHTHDTVRIHVFTNLLYDSCILTYYTLSQVYLTSGLSRKTCIFASWCCRPPYLRASTSEHQVWIRRPADSEMIWKQPLHPFEWWSGWKRSALLFWCVGDTRHSDEKRSEQAQSRWSWRSSCGQTGLEPEKKLNLFSLYQLKSSAFYNERIGTLGVSTVETNRDREHPSCRDQLFFLGQDFYNQDFSVKTLTRRDFCQDCQDALRLSRFVETRQDCRDLWRNLDIVKSFESENDEKSQRIEKSRRENTKIHALLDRDRDKLSGNAKIFRSRQISQSRLRLFGLDIDVETKSRSLDLDRDFSTVETHFLMLSRFSRLLRLTLWQRRDRDSRSRPRLDKSRPPGLKNGP